MNSKTQKKIKKALLYLGAFAAVVGTAILIISQFREKTPISTRAPTAPATSEPEPSTSAPVPEPTKPPILNGVITNHLDMSRIGDIDRINISIDFKTLTYDNSIGLVWKNRDSDNLKIGYKTVVDNGPMYPEIYIFYKISNDTLYDFVPSVPFEGRGNSNEDIVRIYVSPSLETNQLPLFHLDGATVVVDSVLDNAKKMQKVLPRSFQYQTWDYRVGNPDPINSNPNAENKIQYSIVFNDDDTMSLMYKNNNFVLGNGVKIDKAETLKMYRTLTKLHQTGNTNKNEMTVEVQTN